MKHLYDTTATHHVLERVRKGRFDESCASHEAQTAVLPIQEGFFDLAKDREEGAKAGEEILGCEAIVIAGRLVGSGR